MWETLKLGDALEYAGIYKDGEVKMSTIFMAVIMMGILGATSLSNLATLIAQDATLIALFGLSNLEQKQLYRGLASVSINQYHQWMVLFIKSLQADPRTASRKDGATLGDTTQVAKPHSHKIPGVHIMFLHSEKRFTKGVEIITTHYADSDKDYPLFMEFYEPNEETKAERKKEKARKAAKVNGRKPSEVLDYLTNLAQSGEQPESVILSGNRLNAIFRAGIEKLGFFWLGVSDNRRVYLLDGQEKKQKAKELLNQVKNLEWVEDTDAMARYADYGLADSTIGRVRLIVVEQMADGVKTLYLAPETSDRTKIFSELSNLLIREKGKAESGILHQMIKILRLSRESGIIAQNAAFDAWFCVPWFIKEVLSLGFVRVITKPKENFNYIYKEKTYKLSKLWELLSDHDFCEHQYEKKTCQLASLLVQMAGLGQVKLVFVRQLSRRGNKELYFVLMCTDDKFSDKDVLRIYKLRWKIEVCYREVKQNHCFGKFHSQNSLTNFGQTMLSLVAYSFVQIQKLLLPSLNEKTLGWIKDEYLSVIIQLVPRPDGTYFIDFPRWLIEIGLPDWDSFRLPEST